MLLHEIKQGQKITLTYLTSSGNTVVDGVFSGFTPEGYYFCHNNTRIADFSNNSIPQLLPNYNFHFYLPGTYLTDVKQTDKRVLDIRVLLPNILMKKDPSGTIFRRIYKKEKDLLYLGTIQKDIEACFIPSPMISIVDAEYAESKGWVFHETTQSAEERLQKKRPSNTFQT